MASISDLESRPMSTTTTQTTSSSLESYPATYMSRNESSGQSAVTAFTEPLPTPLDKSRLTERITSYFEAEEVGLTKSGTVGSVKVTPRRYALLNPFPPTVTTHITLQDPTSPSTHAREESEETRVTESDYTLSPQHLQAPSTPVRRYSAKELIRKFESQSVSKSDLRIPSSAVASPKSFSSITDDRLQGPLPALPIPRSKPPSSPSRSPLRSLMNLMGLSKSGGRGKDQSPRRKRVLLAEEIPEREDLFTPKGYQNPGTRNDSFVKQEEGQEQVPILRVGSLLYKLQDSGWCLTQAVLRSPTLQLSSSKPLSAPQFNLRHASVESLPSMRLNSAEASIHGLDADLGDSGELTIFVFELCLPTKTSSYVREQFASTSSWDRGKWVCHLWDAICTANESGSLVEPYQPRALAPYEPPDGSLHDENTHRVEPPLRVVNVSKFVASFGETVRSLSSIDPGFNDLPNSSPGASKSNSRSPWPIPNQHSTTVTLLESQPSTRSTPHRQTPNQTPAIFRLAERFLKKSSSPVPPSPSVQNLGKMSIVQQRLARLNPPKPTTGEQAKRLPQVVANVPGKSSTDSWFGQSHANAPTKNQALSTPITYADLRGGLSTPPTSPNKHVSSTVVPETLGSPTRSRHSQASRPTSSLHRITTTSLPQESSIGMVTENLADSGAPNFDHSLHTAPFPVLRNLPGVPFNPTFVKGPSSDHNTPTEGKVAALPAPLAPKHTPSSQPDPDLGDEEYRLSAISSLPHDSQDHLSPLFSLVRDSALQSAARTAGVLDRLELIQNELQVLKSFDKGERLSDAPSTQNSVQADHVQPLADGIAEIQDKLGELSAAVKESKGPCSTEDVLKDTLQLWNKVPEKLDALDEIRQKMGVLETLQGSLGEGSQEKYNSLETRLNDLKSSMVALNLAPLIERLDSIKSSLAAAAEAAKAPPASKEAKEVNSPMPPPPPGQLSAFRNAAKSKAGDSDKKKGDPPSSPTNMPDLSSIHAKLDALKETTSSLKVETPTSVDLTDVTTRIDAVMDLCKQLVEKSSAKESAFANVGASGKDEQKEGGLELSELLSHLQEDQMHRERYYTDLNGWLQTNATQTGTEYHSMAAQLQQITQLLGPLPELQSDANQAQDGTGTPSISLFQDIRQALIENNNRSRTNDNFLAAANQLIGSSSAERQNLASLIMMQRKENEKLLSHFAQNIVTEIRGEKHRFVDAMESATALNLEGQLTELKKQISTQFFSMAEEVELLRDQRKGLEHQIAELLTFKNKFAQMQQPTQRQNSTTSSLQVPRSQASHSLTHVQSQNRGPLPAVRDYQEAQQHNRQGGGGRPLPIPSPRPS